MHHAPQNSHTDTSHAPGSHNAPRLSSLLNFNSIQFIVIEALALTVFRYTSLCVHDQPKGKRIKEKQGKEDLLYLIGENFSIFCSE